MQSGRLGTALHLLHCAHLLHAASEVLLSDHSPAARPAPLEPLINVMTEAAGASLAPSRPEEPFSRPPLATPWRQRPLLEPNASEPGSLGRLVAGNGSTDSGSSGHDVRVDNRSRGGDLTILPGGGAAAELQNCAVVQLVGVLVFEAAVRLLSLNRAAAASAALASLVAAGAAADPAHAAARWCCADNLSLPLHLALQFGHAEPEQPAQKALQRPSDRGGSARRLLSLGALSREKRK